MAFNPRMKDENGNEIAIRYVHQPLSNDHFGIHYSIKENGRVNLKGIPDSGGEYDEVEIPAALIFKLATLLKETRTMVPLSQVEKVEKV